MAKHIILKLNLTLLENGLIDDGFLHFTSGAQYPVQRLANGNLKGLSQSSIDIIEKYDLNGYHESEIRNSHVNFDSFAKQHSQHIASPIKNFSRSLIEIAALNRNKDFDSHITGNLFRTMLYGNVITALESLLSDYAIEAVKHHNLNYESLRLNHQAYRNLQNHEVIEELRWTIFHNLKKANAVYAAMFKVNLPTPEFLISAISNRQDIFHRNGRKQGQKHPEQYSKEQVFDLIIEIQRYAKQLLSEIKAKNQHL